MTPGSKIDRTNIFPSENILRVTTVWASSIPHLRRNRFPSRSLASDKKGKVINLMPEFESCRQAAEEKKVPLKEVYQEAISKGRETIKNKG